MMWMDLLLGALLVLAGRDLFWLCVGVAGFLAGMHYGLTLGPQGPNALIYVLAVVIGLVGAVLAVAFEWATVVFVLGFLGGGYLFLTSAPYLFPAYASTYAWIIFFAGGIIGALLVMMTFDWALIIISSLVGASLIAHAVNAPTPAMQIAFFAGALIIGIAAQSIASNKPPVNEA